ncbi:MAG: aldo/keto reductase [Coriobacteriia bacterium]|nr:aldo/keto reductase [Coriobacteriia bacterium]
MLYNDFKGKKISAFGMGCMRLPKTDASDDASVDEAAAEAMVDYAYEQGVNYFDTAWGYHNGRSEGIVGRALAKYDRSTFNLVTKFPGYDRNNWGKNAEIFEEQLRRCQVDYFDFYLIHNVCEMNIDAYLDEERYGTKAYFLEQRDAGRIRHLGFSIHGSLDVMKRFLDFWGDCMEFVQIQLNYIDYTFQDAKAKLELAAEYDLPVIVMEPLRGGMLAKATDAEMAVLDGLRPGASAVEWALRYLQGFGQVLTVLCGSSDLEQMKENVGCFQEAAPLSPAESEALAGLVEARLAGKIQPCTACRYCVSHCPCGIDIPWMLELFNEHAFTGGGFIAPMALRTVAEGKRPADCIACGACSDVCPQQIDIPGALAEFAGMLGK